MEYYCFKTERYALVLPKQCPGYKVGSSHSVSETSARVVIYNKRSFPSSSKPNYIETWHSYILINDATPSIAYEYRMGEYRSFLAAIHEDTSGKINVAKIFSDPKIFDTTLKQRRKIIPNYVEHSFIGPDDFGTCAIVVPRIQVLV